LAAILHARCIFLQRNTTRSVTVTPVSFYDKELTHLDRRIKPLGLIISAPTSVPGCLEKAYKSIRLKYCELFVTH